MQWERALNRHIPSIIVSVPAVSALISPVANRFHDSLVLESSPYLLEVSNT